MVSVKKKQKTELSLFTGYSKDKENFINMKKNLCFDMVHYTSSTLKRLQLDSDK